MTVDNSAIDRLRAGLFSDSPKRANPENQQQIEAINSLRRDANELADEIEAELFRTCRAEVDENLNQQYRRCSACGWTMWEQAHYCSQCGAKVVGE